MVNPARNPANAALMRPFQRASRNRLSNPVGGLTLRLAAGRKWNARPRLRPLSRATRNPSATPLRARRRWKSRRLTTTGSQPKNARTIPMPHAGNRRRSNAKRPPKPSGGRRSQSRETRPSKTCRAGKAHPLRLASLFKGPRPKMPNRDRSSSPNRNASKRRAKRSLRRNTKRRNPNAFNRGPNRPSRNAN